MPNGNAIRRVHAPDGTVYEIHGEGFTDDHAQDIVRQLSPPHPMPPPPDLPSDGLPLAPSQFPKVAVDWLKTNVPYYLTDVNQGPGGELRVGHPEELRQKFAEVMTTPILPPPPEAPTDIPSLTPRMFGPTKTADALYGMARGMSSPLNLGTMAMAPTLWPEGMAGKALGAGLGVPMAAEGVRQMQAGETLPGAINVGLAALPLVGGFKGKVVPPFYSQLERVIEAKMPNVTTVDQLAGILKDPSIKQTEMETTGLGRWLDTLRGSTRKVTKDEVRTQLGLGKVELQDVDYSSKAAGEIAANEKELAYLSMMRDQLRNQAAESVGSGLPGGPLAPLYDRIQDITDRMERLTREREAMVEAVKPKFASPSLQLPGGSNYREKLLVMPGGRERIKEWAVIERFPNEGRVRDAFPTEGQALNVVRDAVYPEHFKVEPVITQEPLYTEPHFNVDNVVAHGRFTDRTTTTGEPMLFGEELQSQAALDVRKAAQAGEPSPWKGFPFEKNWHEIMLWKALRMAAEEGKTRFGWTTGEQQIERYNLGRQVREIHARQWGPMVPNNRTPGHYALDVVDHQGERPFGARTANIPPDQLADYVGTELANKIKAEVKPGGDFHTYSGPDLRVGGEGKRQLYDQMLVQAANRIGKRYGVKAEDVQIGVKPKSGQPTLPTTVHSLPITPELRAALLGEGRPLFQSPLPWMVGVAGAGLAAGAAAGKGEAADRNKPVLPPPPPPPGVKP